MTLTRRGGRIVTPANIETHPLEEPLAELERLLIAAYLAGAGWDFHALVTRDDEEARKLLTEASRFASAKLSEVESRSDYVRKLHGERTSFE
jgi:hypothetical protein